MKKIYFFIFIIKLLKTKILIIISFIILLKLSIFNYLKKKDRKNKVCLCTVGKLENNYIREFINHYTKYGVDKFFIYDNNDINGERFDTILSKEIKLNYVEILHYRGQKQKQLEIFDNCYKKNNKNFDWLIFYDLDEFINLKNFSNIKDFLNQKKFNKCQSIYLNWLLHTDNNLIYYDNRSLFERFPEVNVDKNFCRGKTIIRGYLGRIKMESTHTLDRRIGRCNGFGEKFITSTINCKIPDYNYYFIDHFHSKSTEEFINKINKGDCVFGNNKNNKYERIDFYFKFNKITLEKINFIALRTGLNISLLKEKYKKKINLKIFKNNFYKGKFLF